MNSQLVTTGIIPLTIGSTETFQLSADADGLYWDLTGGSAILRMTDPNGTPYAYTATISGPAGGAGAIVNWTVIGPAGDWRRAWEIHHASGAVQVTRAIAFEIVASP